MTPSGSSVRRLTPTAEGEGSANWSPNGKKILFSRWNATVTKVDLYTMNRDGTGTTGDERRRQRLGRRLDRRDTEGQMTRAGTSPDWLLRTSGVSDSLRVLALSTKAACSPGRTAAAVSQARRSFMNRRSLSPMHALWATSGRRWILRHPLGRLGLTLVALGTLISVLGLTGSEAAVIHTPPKGTYVQRPGTLTLDWTWEGTEYATYVLFSPIANPNWSDIVSRIDGEGTQS